MTFAISVKRTFNLASIAAAGMVLAMHPAAAQGAAGGGTGSLATFINNVANMLTGTVGQSLAIVAVCIVGFSVMFGSLNMRTAGGVVLGIAILFSAAWVVGQITGGAA